MKDETFGRHVRWIEDHESCQDIAVRETFLHMGNEAAKEFHSSVLLEHEKLWLACFPDIIAFFGISCCCTNCFFLKEPFTMPFSVFLFLFAVYLVKSIFQNTEIWNWSVHKTETCVWMSKNKPFDWLSKQCNTTTLRWPHELDTIYLRFSRFSFVTFLFQVEIKVKDTR